MAKGAERIGKIREVAKQARETIQNVIRPHREASAEVKAAAAKQKEAEKAKIEAARARIAEMNTEKKQQEALRGVTEEEIDAAVNVLGESPATVVGEAREGGVADWAKAVKEFEKEEQTGAALKEAFDEFEKKEK